jgi:hypothetical protein
MFNMGRQVGRSDLGELGEAVLVAAPLPSCAVAPLAQHAVSLL